MPDSSAAWVLPPTARICRPIGSRASIQPTASAASAAGTTSTGTGPIPALPAALTLAGMP